MNDLYYHQHLLDSYDTESKRIRRGIKWDKCYVALCSFNVFSFSYHTINYFNKHNFFFLVYLLIVGLWVFLIFFTRKKIKINELKYKEYRNRYDDELKIIDYPKYIKTKRSEKLNKLKKTSWKFS